MLSMFTCLTTIRVYKSLLKPTAYGIRIWGGAKPFRTRTVQAFLKKKNASSRHICPNSLRKDLNTENINL